MSQTSAPARLKPGLTPEAIAAPTDALDAARSGAAIRGKALIFWDLKIPGKKKKLDAIDTDQITPAADCVSESLETLDQRWKAGSFRYLMPDFRERVHRGETPSISGCTWCRARRRSPMRAMATSSVSIRRRAG